MLVLLVLIHRPTFYALLFGQSVICCSCIELFANKAKSSSKAKSGSQSVLSHFILASPVSIAFCIKRSRRIRKNNGDRIYCCCTPDKMVTKSVTPVSDLTQQLESVYNALNIFMYFCGTPYMDNIFHNEDL